MTKNNAKSLFGGLAEPIGQVRWRMTGIRWDLKGIRWDLAGMDENDKAVGGGGVFVTFEGTRDGRIRITFLPNTSNVKIELFQFSLTCLPAQLEVLSWMISQMGKHKGDLIHMAKRRE
jgi:hypothetical protein